MSIRNLQTDNLTSRKTDISPPLVGGDKGEGATLFPALSHQGRGSIFAVCKFLVNKKIRNFNTRVTDKIKVGS
jgi:hypothetical protein